MAEGGIVDEAAPVPVTGEETLTPDDAVDVLEELLPAQNKSYELGLKLKLQHYVVEAIHSKDLPPDKYLFRVLIKFLQQVEPRPTWRVIIEALRSPSVLPTLAKKVEAAHFPDQVSTSGTESTTGDGEEVKSKPLPQLNPAIGIQKSVAGVRTEIQSFQGRFESMKQSTIHCLERFKIAVATVAYMLTSIEALDEHELFLMDNHEKIHSCRQHWELFGFLNFYWNYLAYDLLHQLLEVLTRKESLFSVELQKMQEYQSEIEEFRGSTTLELFCKAQPHIVADPPPDFRKMVTEHNWPATVTLEHVELFRRKLQQTYNLKKCALMVKSVKKGSFTVTWFVHVSGVDMLKKTMTLHLIDEFEVTRLEIDGACIHRQEALYTSFFTRDEAGSFATHLPQKPAPLQSSTEDYFFVEQPSEDFSCPVMMDLLLEPHETSCCGKHLSQEAATRIQRVGGACPLCNEPEWSSVLSKHFQREVKELRVFCRYWGKGCAWQGELAAFHGHIQSCVFKPPDSNSILVKAIGCLLHQENCQILQCPCRKVKQRFKGILPQVQLHMQREAKKVAQKSEAIPHRLKCLHSGSLMDLLKLDADSPHRLGPKHRTTIEKRSM